MSKPVMEKVVEQLYLTAMGPNVIRDPRSQQYKEGLRAALSNRLAGAKFDPPYQMGTVEADAWHAGWREGEQHARNHVEQVSA